MLWLATAIGCGVPEIPKSQPTAPTVEMKSSSIAFPADSPIAPLFPKGKPSFPTGPLGRFHLGMSEADARAVATEIARAMDDEAQPAKGVVGFGGALAGYDKVGFMVLCTDGVLTALDVTVPLVQATGVLELAWGEAESSHLPNGNPAAIWRNPDQNLKVTWVNVGAGKVVIAFEPLK